ncbi:hypothetical protein M378DRAFT_169066 [Amanita muscaria Koide BX008]|uniref:Uncharacterized protein n=1 Tax=Amanita muscaria (strain Koide BX008) TaxID=946122 RepID=A0A0C2SZK0_AMAMK|nr:hypothetical protein M378DRAFT_169066 [Amanita muscaria Koide BX008]
MKAYTVTVKGDYPGRGVGLELISAVIAEIADSVKRFLEARIAIEFLVPQTSEFGGLCDFDRGGGFGRGKRDRLGLFFFLGMVGVGTVDAI